MSKKRKDPRVVAAEEAAEIETALRDSRDAMMLGSAHPAVGTAVRAEIENIFRKLGMIDVAAIWNKVAWSA